MPIGGGGKLVPLRSWGFEVGMGMRAGMMSGCPVRGVPARRGDGMSAPEANNRGRSPERAPRASKSGRWGRAGKRKRERRVSS